MLNCEAMDIQRREFISLGAAGAALAVCAAKPATPLEQADFRYGLTRVNDVLAKECARRGITITDWHIHLRGGMTAEMAAERERASGIRSGVLENHGREWPLCSNEILAAFIAESKKARVDGRPLPVGIQVNDRDWYRQVSAENRARLDYILADTMIMGVGADGRQQRLWQLKEPIADPDAWMKRYMAHNLQILDEPISILANPTYLPTCLAGEYDRLWTDARMREVIARAVAKGIALEVQAESPFPRARFFKLAKKMGAKFSFGTNNFNPKVKDLSRWLEVIDWLDLTGEDIWRPDMLRS